MSALWLVKILRHVPHTRAFDVHLTDCAALEVLYRAFDKDIPELTVAHVLQREPLPSVIRHWGPAIDPCPDCGRLLRDGSSVIARCGRRLADFHDDAPPPECVPSIDKPFLRVVS